MRKHAVLLASLLVISILVSECSLNEVFLETVQPGALFTENRELVKRAFFGDQKNVNQIINIDLGGLARSGAAGNAQVPSSISIAVPPPPAANSDDFEDVGAGRGKKAFKKGAKKWRWAKGKKWWKKVNVNFK